MYAAAKVAKIKAWRQLAKSPNIITGRGIKIGTNEQITATVNSSATTFPNTLILNGGLFDFDLTFVVQAILFTILALVTTNVFLSPISKQLDERSEFINYTLRKATILLTFGYEKLIDCVGLLTEEIGEMNRQIKITKEYTNSNFEAEITTAQNANSKILSKLKGDLSIKSAYIFSNITKDLMNLTDEFFVKKFQS